MLIEFLISEDPLYVMLRMLIIILLTLFSAWRISRVAKRHWHDKLHMMFISRFLNILVCIVGFSFALNQISSFASLITTLLAGSGIAVLAISLAAQESLSNLISGITISVSKPFDIGDRVRLLSCDVTGYIETITLRHTIIRTFVNSRIIIPNSIINKEMVENSNFLSESVSNFIDIIITYDSDMDKAMEIIAREIENHPDFIDTRDKPENADPKIKVYVRNLGVYGVELRAGVWTESINNNFSACSDIRVGIKRAFDEEGVKFAKIPLSKLVSTD